MCLSTCYSNFWWIHFLILIFIADIVIVFFHYFSTFFPLILQMIGLAFYSFPLLPCFVKIRSDHKATNVILSFQCNTVYSVHGLES